MPRWQQQYFNKPRQTRTTCAWGTIEQPKAPQMTPMPQMQTPTPWATGQMTMSQPVSYTQTQPMGFAQMANNNQVDPYKPYMNLSGFRNDNWKKTYDTFDEHYPQIIDNPINSNPLINDCVDSPRYQEFIGNTEKREEIGFVKPPKVEQPTTTGITQKTLDDVLSYYPAFQGVYPSNVKDLTQDQWRNIYCQEYYKRPHGELIKHPRVRDMVLDQNVMYNPKIFIPLLQQILNEYGFQVDVDGIIGSRTLKILNSIEDPEDFMNFAKPKLINALRDNPKYEQGWTDRIEQY